MNIHKALTVSSVLCIASFIITAIVPIPAISLLGCTLCGVSVALMWPGMLSMTAAGYPSGGVAMFAILALGGDLGCSIGPQFAGIIADGSSLNYGLWRQSSSAIMLIGLLVLKPMLRAKEKHRSRATYCMEIKIKDKKGSVKPSERYVYETICLDLGI